MTWDEFKSIVDEEIANQELDGSVDIFYIDTGNYPQKDRIDVCITQDGLEIT